MTISCWMSQISVKYLGVKLHANINDNIILMTSPLNWVESILCSSKEPYQDPFIEYTIFGFCLSCDFVRAHNFSAIQ